MTKKHTTVTVDEALLEQAKALNVNVSAASEKGLRAEVKHLEEARIRKIYQDACKEIDHRFKETGDFSDDMRLF